MVRLLQLIAHRAQVIAHRAQVIAHRAQVIAHRAQVIAHRAQVIAQRGGSGGSAVAQWFGSGGDSVQVMICISNILLGLWTVAVAGLAGKRCKVFNAAKTLVELWLWQG